MAVCSVPSCHHRGPKNGCKMFRFPKETEERALWTYAIGPLKKTPSYESRICSCHFVDGQKTSGPSILDVANRRDRRHKDLPSTYDNVQTSVRSGDGENSQEPPWLASHYINNSFDDVILRMLPPGTTCLPVYENIPEVQPVDGYEIFSELMEIVKLNRQFRVMEQELLQRFRTLRDLGMAECEAMPAASGRTEVGGCSQSGGGQGREPDDDGLDALLVLRPELLVPELQDLPTLRDLHKVPTTLTEATRLIFALRKDMLMLLNCVLQRALTQSAQRLVKAKDRRTIKQQRLLDRLSTVFTQAQLSHLREDVTTVSWDVEDYMRSISLRRLCRRTTFEFVRNTMKIPLPSMYSVRSVASLGRFPEVTKRYKELTEHKKLSFKPVRAEKPDQSDTDDTADSDPDDYQARKRQELGSTGRSSNRCRSSKRKWQAEPDDGSTLQPDQPSPRRPCWDAVGPLTCSDSGSSGDDAWLDDGCFAHGMPNSAGGRSRDRGKGRGRGHGRCSGKGGVRQQAERPEQTAAGSGGKREASQTSSSMFSKVPRHPSESRRSWDIPGRAMLLQKARDHFAGTPDFGDVQPANNGWADRDRPVLKDRKPLPGFRSVKKRTPGVGKSLPRRQESLT